MFDGKTFGEEIVAVVKSYLERELGVVMARLDTLEKRLADLPAPVVRDDAELVKMVRGELSGDFLKVKALAQAAPTEVLIKDWIERAIGELPKPEKGEPGIPGEPGLPGKDGAPGKDGKDGKDGVGQAAAIVDRDGNLVVTMTNGTAVNLGQVVGKDGAPGKDGADGVGFDDMTIEHDGERTVKLVFARGETVKEADIVFPVPIDRGVYKEGRDYQAGDGVSWAGSFWIAQKETKARPGEGEGWRLAVKKGRDGKDGAPGKPGEKGQPGRNGQDLSLLGGRL